MAKVKDRVGRTVTGHEGDASVALPPRPDGLAGLADGRPGLGRTSTAEKVAELLRDRIVTGGLPPGQRLSEQDVSEALAVSRNTLREAFRLLGHERLVDHQLNRGVFVRTLTIADVRDLYRLRRMLQGAALREAERLPGPVVLAPLAAAVERGEAAAAAAHWPAVATADLQFHQELVALAGSERANELMRQTMAELRLAFWAIRDLPAFHGPFLTRNRGLLDLLTAADAGGARGELDSYLDDAEAMLLAAYSAGGGEHGPR